MAIQVLNTDSDLTGHTLITQENAYSVSGLWTFNRAPGAPFAVQAGSANVPNLSVSTLGTLASGTVSAPTVPVGAANTGLYSSGANKLDATVNGTQLLDLLATALQIVVAGSAGAPSLYFAGDSTTGLYRAGANNLDVAVGGSQALAINSVGLQIISGFDLFTVQWVDFSGSSTIVGWSSFTTKALYYKRIGSLVMVTFNFQGTSNSTSSTFTLPITSNATNPALLFTFTAEDNGTVVPSPNGQLGAASGTVNLFKDVSGAVWTNTGTKIAAGQFFYQV